MKASPFRAMMNAMNKDLIFLRSKRTRLKEDKRLGYYKSFFLKYSIVRVFNFIRIMDENIQDSIIQKTIKI